MFICSGTSLWGTTSTLPKHSSSFSLSSLSAGFRSSSPTSYHLWDRLVAMSFYALRDGGNRNHLTHLLLLTDGALSDSHMASNLILDPDTYFTSKEIYSSVKIAECLLLPVICGQLSLSLLRLEFWLSSKLKLLRPAAFDLAYVITNKFTF